MVCLWGRPWCEVGWLSAGTLELNPGRSTSLPFASFEVMDDEGREHLFPRIHLALSVILSYPKK